MTRYYEIEFTMDPVDVMHLFLENDISMNGGFFSQDRSMVAIKEEDVPIVQRVMYGITSITPLISVRTDPVPGSFLSVLEDIGDIDLEHAYYGEAPGMMFLRAK